MSRSTRGFTLIEVIGAFFLTIVLMFFVFGTFTENGRQRAAATEMMRVESTSGAALAQVARDLEAALYVARPENRDARDHAWLFVAENSGELGARLLRFQTQNVPRGNLGEHASTWVDVAYFLTEEEYDPDTVGFGSGPSYTLWRWRSVRPPTDATRRIPDENDPRSARVAEGLADFGVTFLDANGSAVDEWDSTVGTGETPLPTAAEIRVSLFEEPRGTEAAADDALLVPGRPRMRAVALAMNQPIDVAALVAMSQSEEDLDCSTISDCADIDDEWFVDLVESDCDGDTELCDLMNASTTTCWSEIVNGWGSVAAAAPAECEELR